MSTADANNVNVSDWEGLWQWDRKKDVKNIGTFSKISVNLLSYFILCRKKNTHTHTKLTQKKRKLQSIAFYVAEEIT